MVAKLLAKKCVPIFQIAINNIPVRIIKYTVRMISIRAMYIVNLFNFFEKEHRNITVILRYL